MCPFSGRRSSTEPENGEEGGVDSPLFFRGEMAGEVAEALDVDATDLLDEHPSSGALDIDSPRRTKALHEIGHRQHFGTVVVVGFETSDLGGERPLVAKPGCSLDECATDRF